MINDIKLSQIRQVQNQIAEKSKNQVVSGSQTNEDSDTIEFSANGKMFQQLVDSAPPAADPERMAALQLAIANGEYQVDYDKLADVLLNDASLLDE